MARTWRRGSASQQCGYRNVRRFRGEYRRTGIGSDAGQKSLAAVMAKVQTICPVNTNLRLDALAAPAQPDAAGLDRVLQVRLLTRDLLLPAVLPVETGHQVAGAQAPAHPPETTAPTLRHLARRR